ncbi:zinc finger, CCHC-type containing protein [Tanacetum coccineum]
MAAAAQNTNNLTIRYEKKLKFVEQPMGHAPPNPETADLDTIDKYYKSVNLEQEVACLMLSSMSPDLQRTLEKYNAYDILKELKTMFEEQAKQELYLDTLELLGYEMPKELGVSLILISLNKDYDQFVQNYNMHSIGKTLAELHAMLKLHENGILKKAETPTVLPKFPPPPKREHPTKDSACHHCKEVGHSRRNCPSYHAELKKRKNASVARLRESRKLKHGALSLYMGNGMRAAVEAIGSFDLILPSEIDMRNLYPNVSSMYNVSNKRAKHGLDSYYLWHSRLGHINKKRVDMLQRDGLLQPTHNKSHEKCNSCIFGKMALKPFPHQVERAKDLLGLLHIDVCSPFRTVSREGASYFITFTDDFSRYGFVYLMKHKHDVFETFKVFQNEVENLTRYALETAARILNMVRTKKVDRTAYEIWHGKPPKLSYLRV